MTAKLYVEIPALAGEPMFTGDFVTACKIVWGWNPDARANARIEEDGVEYDARQLESMRAEDEGEI